MIIMRNWRSDSVAAVPISNFNGVSAKISDPQEGTSKQYESSIRSIYVSFIEFMIKIIVQLIEMFCIF